MLDPSASWRLKEANTLELRSGQVPVERGKQLVGLHRPWESTQSFFIQLNVLERTRTEVINGYNLVKNSDASC